MRQDIQPWKAALGAAVVALALASPGIGQVGRNESVLNPNLAGAEELVALGLDEDVVEALLEARPFLTMTAFDSFLAASLDAEVRAALYPKLFIPIDLNAASREEILLVPGIGKKLAHEFEEYRPYVALAQFRREMGKYVDDEEVARFEQYVFVPIDLNTASDEDIRSIPGIGKKLLHEFKEYRPYVDMAQFRREIGKYVSEREVARLQRYVTLPERIEEVEEA